MPDRTASTPAATVTATPSPTNVAAITNDPAKSRWDLKSSRGRRCRDLYRACLRRAGNPADATVQALAITAAENLALAEVARDAALADPSDAKLKISIAADKAARHALETLGISKPGAEAPMSMADQLAARGYAAPDDDEDDEAGE